MTGNDPYYVRRGWVDEDGQIRVTDSSLKIMHSVDDVYDEEAIDDDDEATVAYRYPAPSDNLRDDVYNTGYFYLGEMVDLVDSTPPSPAEEMDYSPPTAGEIAEHGELGLLAKRAASNPNIHFQLPSLMTQGTYPVNQVSNVFSQSPPYGNSQPIWQDSYPPPPRSFASRPDMSTKHDLASTYGSFTTSHLIASLPNTTSHNAAPTDLPHTGFMPPAPNMTSFPAGTSHDTAAPGMPLTGFVPPIPSMAFLHDAGTNAALPVMPHASFAPPAPSMGSNLMTGLHNAAPPASQHNTGYAPLLPNATYPYRSTNGPATSPDYSALSLPTGSCVGQPIPPNLQPVINALRKLRIIGNTDHPERRILKKPYEGTYGNASQDEQLIRDHFAGGSGLLKVDSPLRDWYGDLSIFSAKMWEFLMVKKARVNMNTKG